MASRRCRRAEAQPLLDAWHEGAAAFPAELRAWAAPCLDAPDPEELGELLDRGFVGICLPAEVLARPCGVERCAPLFELLGERDAPVLVHPGPAPETLRRRRPPSPSWWPALTRYVAAMNIAWHAFAAVGAGRTPVCACASRCWPALAPLHRERLVAPRRRSAGAGMPEVFLDTSSYGPRAIDADDPRPRRRLARVRLGPAGGRCPPSPTSARPSGSRC